MPNDIRDPRDFERLLAPNDFESWRDEALRLRTENKTLREENERLSNAVKGAQRYLRSVKDTGIGFTIWQTIRDIWERHGIEDR